MDNYFARLAIMNEKFFEIKSLWEDIKTESHIIFRENEELKKVNAELKKILKETQESNREEKDVSHKHLIVLYKKGYHVCPLSFAEKRKGDCLFCQKFIKENVEDDNVSEGTNKAPSGGQIEDNPKD